MEDIKEHKRAFDEIVSKYGLFEEAVAEEIADYLMVQQNGNVLSAEEFASKFGMSESEAVLFLSFIARGLQFKKDTIDNSEE